MCVSASPVVAKHNTRPTRHVHHTDTQKMPVVTLQARLVITVLIPVEYFEFASTVGAAQRHSDSEHAVIRHELFGLAEWRSLVATWELGRSRQLACGFGSSSFRLLSSYF